MKSTPPIVLLVALLTLPAAAPVAAAPPSGPNAWCGTHPANAQVLAARHRAFERRLERERRDGRIPLKSAPVVFQDGNIAVIQDDGTIIGEPNLFDLQGRSMQFLRRPKGVSGVRSALGFKQLIGDRVDLGDDDSIRINLPAGFELPFGDRVYTAVWINSDGNITLGAPDNASTPRSLQRFVNGPPRIAPLFTDLDPERTRGENGVYVNFLSGPRLRVTWLGVPVFGNDNQLNTFQVTLFDTGRVNFAYGDEVEATTAIVGVQPFGAGEIHLIDYDEELPFRPPRRTTIVEEFDASPQRDDEAIARVFLDHFKDIYDQAIVWLDYPTSLGGGAFAWEATYKNDIRGIGLGTFDFSSQLGSSGRLHSFVQMGSLRRYPDDPDEVFLGTNSTMGILGQEAGHRWLAFVRFVDRHGNRSNALLGRALAHWSYFMDSDGSVMEGNDWVERPEGGFISTDQATSRFSELDQYVMGLRAANEVADFSYIEASATNHNASDPPEVGGFVRGERIFVSVRDVIAAEGPRVPAAARAPKSFRMAFILMGRQGQPVSPESIAKLDRIRQRWVEFFQEGTDFRGQARTGLFPR